MPTPREQARSKAIEDHLIPLRAKLDQLYESIVEEDINPRRETTEELIGVLGEIHTLEVEARATKNTRLVGAVVKERDRAREALGFKPRQRRR